MMVVNTEKRSQESERALQQCVRLENGHESPRLAVVVAASLISLVEPGNDLEESLMRRML